jgi:glycosyltransferase involved in cell wall biosynthesis
MSENDHAKPKLWVISELYYPEETSTGYYLTRIAEGLTVDFEVSAICGQPNYAARGTRSPQRERHKNVEIRRVFGTTLDKNVILFRLINMLSLSLSVFLTTLKNFRRGDTVLVVTNPPSMPFIVALSALAKGAGYVLLIHDNYPEILIAAEKARAGSRLVRQLNHLNRWLYKYASQIIVVGRDMRELAGRKTEGLDVPVACIPNWAELERVEPAPRAENPLLEKLGVADRLVFLYAGNMGYPNDLESILECAGKLKTDERFHFIFLGAGVKRKWLEREIERTGIKNVTLLDPMPRAEQKIFLNACDVGIVTLVKKMWGVSVPSRTYNILAAGKPILALTEPRSEIARVIEEEKVGWCVPPDAPGELERVLLEIYEKRELLGEMGARARKAALEKYSLEKAIGDYRAALLPAAVRKSSARSLEGPDGATAGEKLYRDRTK